MDGSTLISVIFLVAAVFVFLQLRNVLGTRTGHERPSEVFRPNEQEGEQDGDNVITVPGMGDQPAQNYREIDRVAKPGTNLNKGLRAIQDASPMFNVKEFQSGAGMAYEMIVMAFAEGDRQTLKNLLSRDVYEGFEAAINDREKRGETLRTKFVGIEENTYETAELRDHEAHITMNIVSQLITSTVDKDGSIVDGDADAVVEVKDVWTFARDVRDADPNWKLVATESDD